jgi:hypothetical protein
LRAENLDVTLIKIGGNILAVIGRRHSGSEQMFKLFGTRPCSDHPRARKLAGVRAATSAAISQVHAESANLEERILVLNYKLACALGDLEAIYYEREPEDEIMVSALEHRFMETVERSKVVGRQLDVLHDIEKLLQSL